MQKVLPRLGRSERHEVTGPHNGWVDGARRARRPRPARAAAAREGALVRERRRSCCALGVEDGAVVRYSLFERGSVVDEYLSVPEYYGPLPPGDVVALGANPTVVARLTGADPARVREVARTGASPDELPPALELLRSRSPS